MILVTIHNINYVTFIISDSVFYPLAGFTMLIWNHDFVFFGPGSFIVISNSDAMSKGDIKNS